jgi:sterol desaturase/sphingolipid hydroxylase (fatty acid hydroxylase superfamily)
VASSLRYAQQAFLTLWIAAQLLILSGILFGGLAVVLRGEEAFAALRRGLKQIRVNLSLYFLDALFVAPVVGILVQLIRHGIDGAHLSALTPSFWASVGPAVTFAAAIFLGDFGSYWRHRLEHTRLLWPTHAIHHSDDEMSWLTLSRFHPLNRVTTSAVDITFLAVLGFPDWALVANEIIRHYYGEFIHCDLPWTYGMFKTVLVSPAMHRWHHARDVEGSGSNFATVFAVFDRAFGTFYVPGPCNVSIGVTDAIADGALGQLAYPFVAWFGKPDAASPTVEHPTSGPAMATTRDEGEFTV